MVYHSRRNKSECTEFETVNYKNILRHTSGVKARSVDSKQCGWSRSRNHWPANWKACRSTCCQTCTGWYGLWRRRWNCRLQASKFSLFWQMLPCKALPFLRNQSVDSKYSPSPKIDTPKIDTFYENSWRDLAKSPILGWNHKNYGLFSDFNIWWASSS